MSSGFVSGGTTDAPIERDDAWLAAQQELEAVRRRKAEESRQQDGRSLFETLEANKAAKQEAFEEANRLKNQFRSLDADEVDFLDSVLESTRAEEERVKKETAAGLEIFRQRQEEADKKVRAAEGGPAEAGAVEQEELFAARKRKRGKEKEGLKGVKKPRRASSSVAEGETLEGKDSNKAVASGTGKSEIPSPDIERPTPVEKEELLPPVSVSSAKDTPAPPAKGGLKLVDYGSDEDDD